MKITSYFLFAIVIISCSKIDRDKIIFNKTSSIDTISNVYQEYHNQILFTSFDTQNIVIENYEEELKIYGKWDTIIVSKRETPFTIKMFPSFKNTKCSEPQLMKKLYKFGQLYKSQCWYETNSLPWMDSGVEKIISIKYGVIFSRGSFINSGFVISSINGERVPEKIKKKLISN